MLFIKQLKTVVAIVGLFCLFMLNGCGGAGGSSSNGGGSGGGSGLSSAKEITSYKVNNINALIDGHAKTISFTLPYGTDITNLSVIFTTTGASVTVGSTTVTTSTVTTSHDFTQPVVYTVKALDGTTNIYTAIATVASKTDKAISNYSISGFPNNSALIDEANGTIALTLPYGTNLTNLRASFITTGVKVTAFINNVDVPQISDSGTSNGTTIDFSGGPVNYTVTAADTTTKSYTVTVTLASNTAKAITSYGITDFPDNLAQIDETHGTIALKLPYGTDLTKLKANFISTGVQTTAFIGNANVIQISDNGTGNGTTIDFSVGPVVYTVTAGDTTTKSYTVSVTDDLNTAKAITNYSISGFPDNAGTIDDTHGTIMLTLPFGTDLTKLKANFITTGVKITALINEIDVPQISDDGTGNGTTIDFSGGPVVYTVIAADNTPKSYTVTVKVAANTAKSITSYGIQDFPAAPVTIDEDSGTILVTLPYGTDVTKLKANFITTGVKITALINEIDVPQISDDGTGNGTTIDFSGDPVVYTVTAADTSFKSYTVTVKVAANTAKSITTFEIKDFPDNLAQIDETHGTIVLKLPYGTDLTQLVANFATTGEQVKVLNVVQKSGETKNDFTIPVTYMVTAADWSVKSYIVKVTLLPQQLFLPYYPKGCTLNNDTTGVIGTCTCILDANTLDVWKASPNEDSLKWASAETWAMANNASATCGFTRGWGLPTKDQLDHIQGYLAGNNSGDARSIWLNRNGFMKVKPDSQYWGAETGSGMPPPYDLAAYMISMDTGNVGKTFQAFEMNTWAVHTKPSDASYAYVLNPDVNMISMYSINGSNGLLEFLGSIQTGTNPSRIVIDPSGHYVYVTNTGDNIISKYSINSINGELTPLGIINTGSFPMGIAINPSGQYTYVANNAGTTLSMYSLRLMTGELLSGIPQNMAEGPLDITFEPSGNYAYVINNNTSGRGATRSYSVDNNTGALNLLSTMENNNNPSSIVVEPTGRYAYVTNEGNNTLSMYTINSGRLVPAIIPAMKTGKAPQRIRFEPSGKYAYVTNLGDNTISMYGLNIDGILIELPGSPISTGTAPVGINFDRTGHYVYVTNNKSNSISIYSIDESGVLHRSNTIDTNDIGGPADIAIN